MDNDIENDKLKVLKEIKQYENLGYLLPKHYDINSSYEEMQLELNILKQKEKENYVKNLCKCTYEKLDENGILETFKNVKSSDPIFENAFKLFLILYYGIKYGTLWNSNYIDSFDNDALNLTDDPYKNLLDIINNEIKSADLNADNISWEMLLKPDVLEKILEQNWNEHNKKLETKKSCELDEDGEITLFI